MDAIRPPLFKRFVVIALVLGLVSVACYGAVRIVDAQADEGCGGG